MIWIKAGPGTLHEPVDARTFERSLAAGVREVVRKQAAVGIDIVDNGECRKVNWITCITERVRGLERTENFALS